MSFDKNFEADNRMTRRDFVSKASLAATSLTLLPSFSFADGVQEQITVQQVIDMIIKDIPNAPYKQTVDTLKSGSSTQIVTGIVTTMFATVEVIQRAIALKANFIIAHEPTFFNHADETEWLAQDPVYLFKKNLLDNSNIAVWRCHDYIHSRVLDGVQKGVLNSLGWSKFYNADNPRLVKIDQMSLKDIIHHVKQKLQIERVRYIGDLNQTCTRVVLSPGAAGGKNQIQTLREDQPDLFICGELQEWETSEYVRDARSSGKKVSLIVLGHALSEEPGMEWLKDWLQPKLTSIKITHVPSLNPFSIA